jgi:hypothetical protein
MIYKINLKNSEKNHLKIQKIKKFVRTSKQLCSLFQVDSHWIKDAAEDDLLPQSRLFTHR